MSQPSAAAAASNLGNLVRLNPWRLDELPAHSSLPAPTSSATTRPDLLKFLLAILDEGGAFLAPQAVAATFSRAGTKSAPPSDASVEVLKRSIPPSRLSQIPWSSSPIVRQKPSSLEPEHWFARRSVHKNVGSKETKGSASWEEFVYGLRDNHSQHECDFTPTLYDAHHVLDWNDEIKKLENEGKFEGRYSSVGMGSKYMPDVHVDPSNCVDLVYEMCHAIPPPLQPRCFPVLVLTASTSPTSFIAVTVPVNLSSLASAFYTSGKNVREGADAQQRRTPVLGVYTAVETVRILDDSGDIEWTMATASDAKGVLPMWVQKLSLPGAIPKDVSYFMDWIASVPEQEVKKGH